MPDSPPVRVGAQMLLALQTLAAKGGGNRLVRAGEIMREVSRQTRQRNGSAVVRRCWRAGLIIAHPPQREALGPDSRIHLSARGVSVLVARRG